MQVPAWDFFPEYQDPQDSESTMTTQATKVSHCASWHCRHTAADKNGEPNLEEEAAVAPPSAKVNNQKMTSLGLLTQNNIEVVKRINRASFPLVYGEKFYSTIIDNRELCRLAFVCDIPVGCVCCRLVPFDHPDDTLLNICEDESNMPSVSLAPPRLPKWELTTSAPTVTRSKKPADIPTARLCVSTLAVLAPYRRSGIGRMLLEWVIKRCEHLRVGQAETAIGGIPGLPPGQTQVDIKDIFLHVWSSNTTAIQFYKSMGFEQAEVLQGYYRNLSPSDAIVFKKSF